MKKSLIYFFALVGSVLIYSCFDGSSPKQKSNSDAHDTFEVDRLTGAEQFAMYHSNIRKSPKNSPYRYKTGYKSIEYNKLKKRQPKNHSRELVWEERGPGNVSGRTRTIWIDPRDESGETWFVGSAQGGVWKTEDAGQTYQNKSPDVPHLGTAAIMGCKSVPEVIYAGSGEGFNFVHAGGAGIYKSEDGGETWRVLEATANRDDFANVLRMAVHPENPDIVFAATRSNNSIEEVDGYIMRSKDGGETWEEVLNHFDEIPDLLMSPENGDVLYAALSQEGVLKSIDGGDNWDFVWLFESPELRPGRIELAVSPSDPNYVYFTTPINDVSAIPGDQIFVSDNAGETFTVVTPNRPQDDYSNFSGGQSFWNKAITVDPFDPLKIYFGGQSALLSMEVQVLPGLSIGELTVISDGYGAFSANFETSTKGVHVDHHGIEFSVVNEETQEVIMINTNDGGVAVSRDNGATFTQTGDTFLQGFNPEEGQWETVDGYNVSTFYGVDKMNGADRYVGGTQDNGSWVSPADPGPASRWSYAPSGDGFETAWNYDDPAKVIETSQYNRIYRSLDSGETWELLATPGFGPFITAVANSKQEADFVAITTDLGPAISTDFGTTWVLASIPSEYQYNFLRTPIDISLYDPAILWSGSGMTFSNRICLSRDGGQTFQATAPYELQELGEVSGIATHPADAGTAYALFGTAGQPKVVRTMDYGATWEDISGFEGTTDGTSSRGFPDVAVFSLLVMPYDTDIIWVGTEIGIVESLDNGETWNLIDDGLPATAIWEMKVVNDEVVLATHGRGIWTTSLPELAGYEPPTPFLQASKFTGNIFDKKLNGVLEHRTAIDSGEMTITVETFNSGTFSRTYPIGAFAEPTIEQISLDLEDFDVGDVIYEADIETKTYRGDEVRSRSVKALFYDVDLEDEVENYEDDFNDGNTDFAVGKIGPFKDHFSVSTPNGFDNNGLESARNITEQSTLRFIFQKPIRITNSGTSIAFDEIVFLNPGFDIGDELFYSESVILSATNNRGETWVQLAEYSSEAYEEWEFALSSFEDPTSDLYRQRRIPLFEYFAQGDEVFFRLEMNVAGFFNSWGYILDNFKVEPSVSTEELPSQSEVHSRTFMNPFVETTTVQLSYPNTLKAGKATLYDVNGQLFDSEIFAIKTQSGTTYQINGANLSSGIYFLRVQVGDRVLTEKLIKMH